MNEKTKKWVSKAKSKRNSGRSKFEQLARLNGRVVATDGFRIHAWKGESDLPEIEGYPDALGIIEDSMIGETKIIVSTYHLIRALKATLSLRLGNATTAKLSVSSSLFVQAKGAEVGTISCVIHDGDNWRGKATKVKYPNGRPNIVKYNHNGPSLHIAFNPKYLLDALRGMGDEVTMVFSGKHRPVYIKAENKEAVIMPMSWSS